MVSGGGVWAEAVAAMKRREPKVRDFTDRSVTGLPPTRCDIVQSLLNTGVRLGL